MEKRHLSSIKNISFDLAPKIRKIIIRDSSKFRSHPGDDLHDDPGARLLQHGHGQVVRDALQAVAVHGQQTITASKNEKRKLIFFEVTFVLRTDSRGRILSQTKVNIRDMLNFVLVVWFQAITIFTSTQIAQLSSNPFKSGKK